MIIRTITTVSYRETHPVSLGVLVPVIVLAVPGLPRHVLDLVLGTVLCGRRHPLVEGIRLVQPVVRLRVGRGPREVFLDSRLVRVLRGIVVGIAVRLLVLLRGVLQVLGARHDGGALQVRFPQFVA